MKYSLLSIIISWIFPTQRDRNRFRKFCWELDNRDKIKKMPARYSKIISSIQKNPNKKIKVLFLVNDISKWKTQSLYDIFSESEDYEPVIALTIADVQKRLSPTERNNYLHELYKYFTDKNMKCIYAWNTKTNRAINLKEFKPNIVFYQQPWGVAKNQTPDVVSNFALTCYVPYFVPNYGIMNMDYLDFHKFLFRNYVLNKDWENIYKKYAGNYYNDNIYAVGHTMLDSICLNREEKKEGHNYVIYAPHWSIPYAGNENDENYGTFLWNHKLILNYAQNHPEFNWVFKPHPTLKLALKRTGLFSDNYIENYYNEWEKIATVCYSSNYMDIFLDSRALITDCGSFLIEYFCTGKPVIHLVSDKCNVVPPPPTLKIFDTFYKVENADEFDKVLDTLLQKNNDYKREERLNVLKESNLNNCYAAKNIFNDLNEIIKGGNNG